MALPIEVRFQTVGRPFAIYYFKDVGDELPLHHHPVDQASIVVAGKVKAVGIVNGKKVEHEISHPHLIYMEAPHPHSLVALEPNTIVVNAFKVNV